MLSVMPLMSRFEGQGSLKVLDLKDSVPLNDTIAKPRKDNHSLQRIFTGDCLYPQFLNYPQFNEGLLIIANLAISSRRKN